MRSVWRVSEHWGFGGRFFKYFYGAGVLLFTVNSFGEWGTILGLLHSENPRPPHRSVAGGFGRLLLRLNDNLMRESLNRRLKYNALDNAR